MNCLRLLALVLLSPLAAQEVDFEFHVYQTDPTIGAALEERLIAGGDDAAEAVAKLPDFVRQNRVTEIDSLTFSAPPGERTIGKSSEAMILLPNRETAKGLEVEVDPVIAGQLIEFNFFASLITTENGDARERVVTSQTQIQSGVPALICRWQIEDEWLLLMGTATLSGEDSPATSPQNVFYVESAYYATASSAKFARDRLASTLIPCRDGQQSRSIIIGWIDDENILEDEQPGFRSRLDPEFNEDGTLKLRVDSNYIIEAGGRTRLESGERVRRLEIREVSEILELTEGEPAGRRATLSGLDDRDVREDNHVAAFRFSRQKTE